MKRMLSAVLLLVVLFLTACSGEKYGTGIDPGAQRVTVQDIFLKPALFGTEVTLEGKVNNQCLSNGCWFVLQDETGQIYIDLSQNNMTMPGRQGRKALVSGTVTSYQNNLLLVAKGVEVK